MSLVLDIFPYQDYLEIRCFGKQDNVFLFFLVLDNRPVVCFENLLCSVSKLRWNTLAGFDDDYPGQHGGCSGQY